MVRDSDQLRSNRVVVEGPEREVRRSVAERMKLAGCVDEDHLAAEQVDALGKVAQCPALAGASGSDNGEVTPEKPCQGHRHFDRLIYRQAAQDELGFTVHGAEHGKYCFGAGRVDRVAHLRILQDAAGCTAIEVERREQLDAALNRDTAFMLRECLDGSRGRSDAQ